MTPPVRLRPLIWRGTFHRLTHVCHKVELNWARARQYIHSYSWSSSVVRGNGTQEWYPGTSYNSVLGEKVVYYETINREINKGLTYECRCDERLKPIAERSTHLGYTAYLHQNKERQSRGWWFYYSRIKKRLESWKHFGNSLSCLL